MLTIPPAKKERKKDKRIFGHPKNRPDRIEISKSPHPIQVSLETKIKRRKKMEGKRAKKVSKREEEKNKIFKRR